MIFRRGQACGAVLVCAGVLLTPAFVLAEENAATLASPVAIMGEVRNGDIVAYDASTKTYIASQKTKDENMFGVVVDDPVLYMHDNQSASGTRPVVRFGEAVVNVTDEKGAIKAGDLVTSSRVIGAGEKFDRATQGFMLGFALAPATYDTSAGQTVIDGRTVRLGTVLVALRIGYYDGKVEEGGGEGTTTIPIATSTAGMVSDETGNKGIDTFLLIRYLLGSFVALTAVVLALRRFGDLFAQSIVSVGRNPLARSQIRSILVWNAVLIVVVSGVGLGIGVAIIVL